QERQVTVGDSTRPLPAPFFVLATQNPIELEGTYPLPEAQLDRFFFKLLVPFPDAEQLAEIAKRTTGSTTVELNSVAGRADVRGMTELAREVPIASHAMGRAVQIVLAAAPARAAAPPEVHESGRWRATRGGPLAGVGGVRGRPAGARPPPDPRARRRTAGATAAARLRGRTGTLAQRRSRLERFAGPGHATRVGVSPAAGGGGRACRPAPH